LLIHKLYGLNISKTKEIQSGYSLNLMFLIMAENKNLREEQDKPGSNPFEVYDFEYFRTKFGLTTEQVIESIREAKSNNPLQLEEYLAAKYNLPEDGGAEGNI